jgi:hypothetical protein
MRVLLLLSKRKVHRKDNLELYLALAARIPDLVWCSGTSFDMDKMLAQGALYLDLVNPDDLDAWPKATQFAPNAFDIAIIDQSFDLTQDQSPAFFGGGIANRSLDFEGNNRPSELARELTQLGTVCIGISRSRRCLQELSQFGGAVMGYHRDQMVRDCAQIMREATRLVQENQDIAGAPLRALTLRQPFAWSVFHAGKDIENRNWPVKVRGTIAIHAADEQPDGSYEAGKKFIAEILRRIGRKRLHVPPLKTLERGAIIGLVDVVDCVTESGSPWFEGPIGVCLINPRLLPKPIPCAGKRRLFTVPADVARQIGTI